MQLDSAIVASPYGIAWIRAKFDYGSKTAIMMAMSSDPCGPERVRYRSVAFPLATYSKFYDWPLGLRSGNFDKDSWKPWLGEDVEEL